MSLQLSYITNEEHALPLSNAGLFGPESWRHSVWGSEAVRELGCVLLPSLKKENIHATGEELKILQQELLLINTSLISVANQTNADEQSLAARIAFALEMVEQALLSDDILGVAIE